MVSFGTLATQGQSNTVRISDRANGQTLQTGCVRHLASAGNYGYSARFSRVTTSRRQPKVGIVARTYDDAGFKSTSGIRGQPQAREDPLASNELRGVANTVRRVGWISFWTQLSLSVISAVILFFSISTVFQGHLPEISALLTLAGVLTSFTSAFFASGYVRAARRVLEGGLARKESLVAQLLRNSALNLWGMGFTILALQAEVGTLVGKTLLSSSTSPYQAVRAAGTPAALDIFCVQASTNTVLAHFASIVFVNFLLRQINKQAGLAAKTA